MIDTLIATWNPERAEKLIGELTRTRRHTNGRFHTNSDGNRLLLPTLAGMVDELENSREILLFLHDDVELIEASNYGQVGSMPRWDEATVAAFDDPKVGLVGWGGATGLGHKDIYKTPYSLLQLAREGYASATTDWKEHGEFLSAPREVAVLDGFALAFRREAYEEMGGWRKLIDMGCLFHGYDLMSCLLMHRLGWKVMAVPVPCRHLGGRTSTTPEYQELLKSLGYENDLEVHQKIHRIIYDEFRSELPVRV